MSTRQELLDNAVRVEDEKFARTSENVTLAFAQGRITEREADERIARLQEKRDGRVAFLRGERFP